MLVSAPFSIIVYSALVDSTVSTDSQSPIFYTGLIGVCCFVLHFHDFLVTYLVPLLSSRRCLLKMYFFQSVWNFRRCILSLFLLFLELSDFFVIHAIRICFYAPSVHAQEVYLGAFCSFIVLVTLVCVIISPLSVFICCVERIIFFWQRIKLWKIIATQSFGEVFLWNISAYYNSPLYCDKIHDSDTSKSTPF